MDDVRQFADLLKLAKRRRGTNYTEAVEIVLGCMTETMERRCRMRYLASRGNIIGMTYDEIATAEKRSRSTVTESIHAGLARARKKLKLPILLKNG